MTEVDYSRISSGFFGGLEHSERVELLSRGRIRHHEAKEVIFAEGESAFQVPILLSGGVKISRNENRVVTLLGICSAGDLLDTSGVARVLQDASGLPLQARGKTDTPDSGLRGLSAGHSAATPRLTRTTTATALMPSSTLTISGSDLARYMRSAQDGLIAIARALADHSQALESRIVDRSVRNTNQRLAKALLSLSLKAGVPNMKDTPARSPRRVSGYRIALTQTDLAAWVGASPKTVEKVISNWRARGVVSTGYSEIVIENLPVLQRIAS